MREVELLLHGAAGADRTQAYAEEFLRDAKVDHIKRGESDPELWDKQRIFRVTIEEVERKR